VFVGTAGSWSCSGTGGAYNQQVAMRLSWFISEVRPTAYRVLDEPDTKTYEALTTMLKQHFSLARNVNTERSSFQARKQLQSESVGDFALALHHLARYCNFGTFLDQTLQTQFINNVRNAQVKDKIAEGFPTFQALLERAIQAELAF
jgi:hypothetical protein